VSRKALTEIYSPRYLKLRHVILQIFPEGFLFTKILVPSFGSDRRSVTTVYMTMQLVLLQLKSIYSSLIKRKSLVLQLCLIEKL